MVPRYVIDDTIQRVTYVYILMSFFSAVFIKFCEGLLELSQFSYDWVIFFKFEFLIFFVNLMP